MLRRLQPAWRSVPIREMTEHAPDGRTENAQAISHSTLTPLYNTHSPKKTLSALASPSMHRRSYRLAGMSILYTTSVEAAPAPPALPPPYIVSKRRIKRTRSPSLAGYMHTAVELPMCRGKSHWHNNLALLLWIHGPSPNARVPLQPGEFTAPVHRDIYCGTTTTVCTQ